MLETDLRCFGQLLARDPRPIESESAPAGQLADRLPLCAAVSIAKGMDGVQLAHVMGRSAGKSRTGEVREVSFLFQLARKLAEALGNLIAEGERELPGAGYVHRAKSSGPGTNVLENVAVDRLKMLPVKLSLDRMVGQLAQAARGHIHFELGETLWIANVAKVFKNARSQVNVRVHTPGQRARR